MNFIIQLALIIVPTGAVVMTVAIFMRKQNQSDARSIQLELKKERQAFFLPNRVDAYQRAVLLMERIHPNSLVMRHNNPGLPAAALQVTLLESIRSEYEHNMAQQIFVSKESWDLVQKAKDETTRIIHLAGQQMEVTSVGMDLSSKIFEIVAEVGVLPTEIAVNILKKELQELF